MNLSFSVKAPNFADFERDIKRDIQSESAAIVKEIVELAPQEMRDGMSNQSPSPIGSPPGVRSGNLVNSLEGQMIDKTTGAIQMAYYAQYLDSFLGGKLDRDFIEQSVDRTVVRAMKSL